MLSSQQTLKCLLEITLQSVNRGAILFMLRVQATATPNS